MTEKITVTGLDDDEQTLLNELLEQLGARVPRNLLRTRYYEGKHAARRFSAVVPPQYHQLGITLGWSGKAVDTLARRCNLDGFVWPDGKLDDLGFAAVARDNHLESETSSGITSALIHGVVFPIVTAGGPGEPPALIHWKDATNATGKWNPRLRRLDALLSILDRNKEGKPTALALYLWNLTITMEAEGGWQVVDRSAHRWGMPSQPMVYRPRTGKPFGEPRISTTVMGLHDAALRTLIRMEGHMDVFSFPEMWLLGGDESLFKNADGSKKAVWEVMLGRLKAIPDDDDAITPRADVKQFRASDPAPHIASFKQQAQTFSGETSIPLGDLGVSDQTNPTSADSYIASREGLIAEAEGADDDFTPTLAHIAVTALAIAHGERGIPDDWRTIAPKWRSPIYLSRAAAADAGSKQLGAVPWLAETEVGLELLGLDEQQIRRALAEKRRNGGSAALRALTDAAQRGQPLVTVDGVPSAS